MKGLKIFVCAFVLMTLCSISAYAGGSWVKDNVGWWYRRGDGRWPNNAWQWLDGNGDGQAECYYFYESGYCALNTDVDGYRVNGDGMWTVNGQVQRMYVGDLIDHINNPGRTEIEGTIEVLTRAEAAARNNAYAERGSGSEKVVIFHFYEIKKIRVMSGDGNNCFIEDVDKVYLPNGSYLESHNGESVTLSFDFRQAYSPTDLEVPYGLIRVNDARLIQ